MADSQKVDRIGRWSVCLLTVVFLLLVGLQTIHPLWSARSNLNAFQEAVGILSNADSSIERLNIEVQAIGKQIHQSEAMLPRQVDLDAFLEQLEDLAKHTGVSVEKFTPHQVADHRLCRELPLSVMISGSFPAIYDFVISLENGNRLARIERMSIQRNNSRDLCEAQMQLALFFAQEKTG